MADCVPGHCFFGRSREQSLLVSLLVIWTLTIETSLEWIYRNCRAVRRAVFTFPESLSQLPFFFFLSFSSWDQLEPAHRFLRLLSLQANCLLQTFSSMMWLGVCSLCHSLYLNMKFDVTITHPKYEIEGFFFVLVLFGWVFLFVCLWVFVFCSGFFLLVGVFLVKDYSDIISILHKIQKYFPKGNGIFSSSIWGRLSK